MSRPEGDPDLAVLETTRLMLRRLEPADAPFIFELVNDPDWLRFIGDRQVRSLEDAEAYILNGPVEMYRRLGFGLYLVALKEGGLPVGICGLIQREELEDVDLGFAFLPQARGRGYAFEAASAIVEHGRRELGLRRVVAIVSPENVVSARLLEKLGFRFEKVLRLTEGDEVRLFAWSAWPRC